MIKNSLFFILVLFLCACSSDGVVEVKSPEIWNKNQSLEFSFEVSDVSHPKNISFVIRNNNDYPYSNLFLFGKIMKDNHLLNGKTDTINYQLAYPNGEWIGKGFGEVKEIEVLYKRNYRFPQKGKYKILVQHGMRQKNLKGIEDIGVKIEDIKINE